MQAIIPEITPRKESFSNAALTEAVPRWDRSSNPAARLESHSPSTPDWFLLLHRSLFTGSSTRRRCPRRQCVDHLARTRVVQLFTRLMLNRVRIVLQPVNMSLQEIILPLQTVQLAIQALCILTLLLIDRQPILPKNDVVPQPERKQRSGAGRNLSPTQLTTLVQTHKGTCLFCLRARSTGTSHIQLSTNFMQLTVKWKTHFTSART
jgi:hypothetical protein